MILDSAQSTVNTTVRLVKRDLKNALGTLVTLNLLAQFITLVRVVSRQASTNPPILTFHPTSGFLTKIKKLLETVCHNCGKIKANTVSHPYRDGKSLVIFANMK